MTDEDQTLNGEFPEDSAAGTPEAPEDSGAGGEIGPLKEKLLRSYAEIENFKKRAARDRAEWFKYANEGLLKEFLSVLDSLARARAQGEGSPELSKWVDGVALIIKQCEDILSRFGVKAIETEGREFDPAVHQALARVESGQEPGTIVEEVQKGYLLHDRVLRPSLVTVAGPGTSESS